MTQEIGYVFYSLRAVTEGAANVSHLRIRFSPHRDKHFPQNDKNHEKRLFSNQSGIVYLPPANLPQTNPPELIKPNLRLPPPPPHSLQLNYRLLQLPESRKSKNQLPPALAAGIKQIKVQTIKLNYRLLQLPESSKSKNQENQG